MAGKDYSLIEHTADIGIRIKSRTLKGLFKKAAQAVFDLSSRKISNATGKPMVFPIAQEAGDIDELFVNWLNELLSFSHAKAVIFSAFKIKALSPRHIQAEARGYPASGYRINKEIKAATYHQLKITKEQGVWQAEVIFDV